MACFQFLKTMMFAFNGIIFLAGGAILGVGVWVKVERGSLLDFLSGVVNAPAELSQVLNVSYLLMGVGGVLMVIGFLGCCGAARESKCMLMLFFLIVFIIFIAEVAGAIVVLVFKPLVTDLLNKVGREVVDSIQLVYGTDPEFTAFLNSTMIGLKCCGFYGYGDFTGSEFINTTEKYPFPCCMESECGLAEARQSNVTGCLTKVGELINENVDVLSGVALGIAALEVFAMIAALSLYCRIGK